MLIQCTKKLLDQLHIHPAASADEEPLFSWHANLITVSRRKTVVLVNDKNRYVIVLLGLKAKDFKMLDAHIIQAIRETFREECIKDEIIEQFLNRSGGITYTKTRDRKHVARMNKACELVPGYEDLKLEGSINQSAMSIRISRLLVGDGPNRYIKPGEELYKDLEALAGKHIFGCKAAVLKVTLDHGKHDVWRKIVVPWQITFARLHQVLQAAFGWQDYHLHEFYVYGAEKFEDDSFFNHPGYHKKGYKPLVNLVSNEEALAYAGDFVPAKLETGIKLSGYLPARIKYIYDFGDSWQHYLEVEGVIDDYDKNYPVCLAGSGNTPPEDVGGEYGYGEFFNIIADKKHPEYERMLAWGTSQGYKDFDLAQVNRDLKFG